MQDLIRTTLGELLKHLNLGFTNITIDDSDETHSRDSVQSMIRVDIDSNEASRLIGWHGETIDAIQHLMKAIIRTQRKLPKSPFIVLDVDGYRRAQEDKVKRIAGQKVDFVRRKKMRIALPPMSPYFRRVVHLYVAGNPDLSDITTESIGEGEYRQVVLKLKEGSLDEGEELVPVVAKEAETSLRQGYGGQEGEEEGFENLDV